MEKIFSGTFGIRRATGDWAFSERHPHSTVEGDVLVLSDVAGALYRTVGYCGLETGTRFLAHGETRALFVGSEATLGPIGGNDEITLSGGKYTIVEPAQNGVTLEEKLTYLGRLCNNLEKAKEFYGERDQSLVAEIKKLSASANGNLKTLQQARQLTADRSVVSRTVAALTAKLEETKNSAENTQLEIEAARVAALQAEDENLAQAIAADVQTFSDTVVNLNQIAGEASAAFDRRLEIARLLGSNRPKTSWRDKMRGTMNIPALSIEG